MSDAVAFALRAEYEGTTTVELEDGSTEERPTFAGGVLHADPGDFDVAEQLEAGKGAIVVAARDQRLVDLLDEYPPLKRVPVPAGAKPISPYDRQPTDALRHLASLREIDGAGSLSRAKLIRALDRQDRELAAGVSGQPVEPDPDDEPAAEETTTDTTAGG
jgi:hypothetical protein